jgi:uncharacterized protein YjbI with pentapeptide repeats
MKIEIKHQFTNAVLCEFEAVDLKDAVQQAVVKGANLSGADLRGADLYGAKLRGANLYGADLYGANLRGADLRGADLYGANLRGADLYGADLYGADLSGANLSGANLRGADLRGERIAIAPILIGGLLWDVCISESFLEIGCQRHEHKVWSNFTDDEISEMSSDAIGFWAAHKSWLLASCKAHRKESLAYRKTNPEKQETES